MRLPAEFQFNLIEAQSQQSTRVGTLNLPGDSCKNDAIVVDSLVKQYGIIGRKKALDGVTFQVKEGDIFALIGPNGAGKTTLMGCLLSLLRPTRGTIKIMGKPPDHIDVRRITGFLPERPSFESWMTTVEFLRYHHMLARKAASTMQQDVNDALDVVDLRSAATRSLSKFSRGMLQRVGLAQLVIGSPRICFMDEPTSGMDPPGMELVRDILTRFRQQGVTVIVNSHHLDEVERVCTRFAFIQHGKITAQEDISNVNSKLLIVRWGHGIRPDDEVLRQALAQCDVTIADCNDEHGKLVLARRSESVSVISHLVRNDIAVEEAYFDRSGLSQLFKRPNEGPGGAESTGEAT